MDFRQFTSPTELHNWASSVYSQNALDKFNLNKQSICSPLSYYAGSFSAQINHFLRRGILESPHFHHEVLQNDLLQCVVPENIVVYRFLNGRELLRWRINTCFGRKYVNSGFVSTTFLPHLFNGQSRSAGFVVKIFVPKGTYGMYITELSDAPVKEYEFLIPHHSSFVRRGGSCFELTSFNSSR